MRPSLLFVLLLSPIFGFTQFKEAAYHCQRDSVISQTKYGSVYITHDHNCAIYSWLCPDPKEWMNNYNVTANFPEMAHILNPQQTLGTFPRYWNYLYSYHGQYYVYGPSDWMANRPLFIADSFLVEISSDITYSQILKKELVDARELLLTLDIDGEQAFLRIRLLSFPQGAALWEYNNQNTSWSVLMVASDFVRSFDLINNDCVDQKCYQEFRFDQIDLSRLKLLN
ncbi:MAG: hypothetical protein ACKOWW_06735 [Flavobacteriales bacterium]